MNTVHESFVQLGQATIALQPVFDQADGNVAFFESVFRMTNTPDPLFHVRMLSLAEQLGFVHYIDLHVLAITVDTLRRYPGMKASINVSQRSILDDGQQIIRRLAASQVADRLIVEITESSEIPTAWVAVFAASAREIGCKVAIDDFETGFADDHLVRATKPDIIKVVVDESTMRYRERVKRTIDLAHEMGALVVAEKIDTDEKIAMARTMGVRYLQGFSFAYPILLADLPELFGRTLDSTVPVNDGSAPGIRLDFARFGQALNGHRQIRLVEKTGS